MITVQITEISFDCSLDDADWSESDQVCTEEKLSEEYTGMVVELDLDNDATDDEVSDELLEEVSTSSGWCINSLDYRLVLS